MNQNSFCFYKQSRLSQLINVIDRKKMESHKHQLEKIINNKKAKLKEKYSLSSHQIIQPEMSPTRKVYPPFTIVPPGSVDQQFVSEKIKNNILRPDRFYSSQPNVKVGSFQLPKKRSLVENLTIVNNQFKQYNRVYDENSGQYKHKKILALIASNDLAGKKLKYMRMKRTLFQKFIPDKYSFYDKNSIVNKKPLQFSILKKSSCKYIGNQQENYTSDIKSHFKPGSTREVNTMEVIEISKEKIQLKRSISGRKPRFSKNLQSLQ